MKIIKVKNCSECPLKYNIDFLARCSETQSIIENYRNPLINFNQFNEILSDCPLQNFEEKQ